MIDTSAVYDSASVATKIKNFCGEYKFEVDTYPIGSSIDSSFKACADDCGSYNSYQLASIEPDKYTMKGEYEMTVKVLLRDYTLAVGLDDTFSYEVIGC